VSLIQEVSLKRTLVVGRGEFEEDKLLLRVSRECTRPEYKMFFVATQQKFYSFLLNKKDGVDDDLENCSSLKSNSQEIRFRSLLYLKSKGAVVSDFELQVYYCISSYRDSLNAIHYTPEAVSLIWLLVFLIECKRRRSSCTRNQADEK
jgi:hypothetical protein